MLFIGIAGAQIDRSVMPTPGPAPTIEITEPQTFTLKNGLKVMVVENHKLPRVSVQLLIDNKIHAEGDIAGVSAILSGMMGNGTQNIDKETYNEEIDYLGAKIGFGNEYASASSLSKYFPRILSLLADGLKNPLFDTEEFEAQKARLIEGLRTSEKSVSAVGSRVNYALTYGVKHPKGEFTSIESVERISLNDVKSYYEHYFSPMNAYLVVVGDVKFKEVKKLVNKELKDWKKTVVPEVTYSTPKDVQYSQINFVNMDNAVQSEIAVINLVDLKMSDDDYLAAVLANHILGGGFNGMINLNLREDKGYTYGAYSGIGAGKNINRFAATTSVRNQVTDSAVVEIMKEIQNIRTIPVTNERLELSKASYTGNFVRALENPSTIARYALTIETENLDPNFYTDYLKRLNAVTVEDIQRVANKYFKAGNLRIVITGKGSEVLNGLKNMKNLDGKPLPIKYFDEYANEVEEPVFDIAIPDGVTAQTVIENYINAIGGTDKLNNVKALSSEASAEIQGMTMTAKNIITIDNQSLNTVTAMGMEISKTVFDGEKGYTAGQGQRIDFGEDEIALSKRTIYPFPELKFKDIELLGAEMVNGKPAYILQVDKNNKWFYDLESGLKVKTETKIEMQGQEFVQSTYYSNYKDVEGVLLPFVNTLDMAGQEIDMNVTEYKINEKVSKDLFK